MIHVVEETKPDSVLSFVARSETAQLAAWLFLIFVQPSATIDHERGEGGRMAGTCLRKPRRSMTVPRLVRLTRS